MLRQLRRPDPKTVVRALRRVCFAAGFAPLPFRVHLDITDRCNCRCPTCSKWKVRVTEPELTADQWRPIFRGLRGRVISRRVVLGGGEPLTRPDICTIIADLKANRFHVILITNGLTLDDEMLDRLEAAGLDNLMISLNSLREEVHDATRGLRGGHRRLMAVLPKLGERRFRTTLATIVLKDNLHELEGLVGLVRQYRLASIIFQILVSDRVHHAFGSDQPLEVPRDWHEHDEQWIQDGQALERTMDRLVAMKNRGAPIANPAGQLRYFKTYYQHPDQILRLPCLAGVTAMCIDPYGKVRLCYCFAPIGDVTRDDPVEVWRSRRARACREAMKRCDRTCRLQNHIF